jgi:hypothetical protein
MYPDYWPLHPETQILMETSSESQQDRSVLRHKTLLVCGYNSPHCTKGCAVNEWNDCTFQDHHKRSIFVLSKNYMLVNLGEAC